MKVSLERVRDGLLAYVNDEMMPRLSTGKKVLLGTYVTLAGERVIQTARNYSTSPALAMLEIMDAEGNVDVERLYQAARNQMRDGRTITMPLPLIGDYTITVEDLDHLYQRII